MKSSRIIFIFLVVALLTGCGGGSGSSTPDKPSGGVPSPASGGGTPSAPTGNNVLSVTVNGSLCSANSYPNKPCVEVTVCTPGTSTCQTIRDILLDTGSVGLRIFKQALSVPLIQAPSGSGSLAECIQFGDGSMDWGPVQNATVILGGEPAVQVPIHVMDATFGAIPTACQNADRSPADAGFNGILGVGPFVQDCGATCAGRSRNGLYYVCGGGSCSRTTASLSSQLQNPVAILPRDNNGVIVQLPSVPLGGVPSVDGFLVLGIGTQSNNSPSAAATYGLNQTGDMVTTFNGSAYTSFIDSGSNGLFFTAPATGVLPNCAAPNTSWFCPSATTNFSAVTSGISGSPSNPVSFKIGNFTSLANSGNNVFVENGGDGGGDFVWGLPFHFGRNVYFGIDGTPSTMGTGPYFAY